MTPNEESLLRAIATLIRRIRRLARKVDGISGDGVTNLRDSVVISSKAVPFAPSFPSEEATSSVVILKITDTCTMKGLYEAQIGTRNATAVDQDAATFLNITDLYSFGGVTVIFANQEEDTLNQTHVLAAGDLVEGELWGATDDATPLYRGHPLAVSGC